MLLIVIGLVEEEEGVSSTFTWEVPFDVDISFEEFLLGGLLRAFSGAGVFGPTPLGSPLCFARSARARFIMNCLGLEGGQSTLKDKQTNKNTANFPSFVLEISLLQCPQGCVRETIAVDFEMVSAMVGWKANPITPAAS